MSEALIRLEGVHKAFGPAVVLSGLDFSVDQGETLVVLGRSGTGKSVMLKTIVGLLRPDRGRVLVAGREVDTHDRASLVAARHAVAFMFQSGALVNWMSVRDNVALPLIEERRLSRREIDQRVLEMLAALDLDQAADKLPEEISGGMRKRAALCRVLVQAPQAILFDEPTAGLDPLLARTVSHLIRDVQERERRAAVVVTHDLELAFALLDGGRGRIGLHHEGQLVEVAEPEAFRNSRHPVVRAFLDPQAELPEGAMP